VIRLFVALDVPAPVRARLAAFAPDDETWRPLGAERLHLTLAFLGSRPEEDVERIAPLLGADAAPRLALGRTAVLGRVLAVDVEDLDGTLGPLQARLSEALEALGVYTPERRPFRPHVSIARLRPRARARRPAGDVERLEFAGEAVTLYASRLNPSGARYEAMARSPI
jgi:2'-5' RNA ligase